MEILSITVDLILAGYIAVEVIRFIPRYRQLKQELAQGDTRARSRIYRQALRFEWIGALLALVALRFDWSRLNPKTLGLQDLAVMRLRDSGASGGMLAGVCVGLGMGTLALILARVKTKRRAQGLPAPVASAPAVRLRRLMPDFSALMPESRSERFLWAAVAVSAGICEEVVFRGWLLSTLHGTLGVNGTALLIIGAVIFGLAHAYQGVTGVILTGLAGAFFCVLYVATGSLLIPILLHSIVDLRFAVIPSGPPGARQTAYA